MVILLNIKFQDGMLKFKPKDIVVLNGLIS